jgi:Na+/melibiose symporter-like transporter
MHHKPEKHEPIDSLRNQLAFGGDSMFFNIGVYFMPITTVLSALAAGFTSDKALIGAISLAWLVGWLSPQLAAARMLRGKAHMKPYSVIPAVLTRPIIFLLAMWLWLDRGASPQLSIWLLLIGIAVFAMADGVTTTAWFDMQARALSPRVRSRVITVNSLIASFGGLGAGVVVERVLASDLPFPLNYAVLLALAFVFYMLSLGCMLFIRERPAGIEEGRQTTDDQGLSSVVGGPSSERGFLAHLLHSVRTDAVLRRILAARLLVGIENMAAAFYVVYSREQLKLPESAVGVFSIAIVVGGLIGIAAFGWLAMRFGARRVLQTANVMQFAAPLLALGVALSGIGGTAAYAVMVVVLGLNGAINRSSQLGYFTYTQESAAEIDRPMYMGAVNSIGGVAALMPLLGGLLIDGLQRSGAAAVAFPAVFALAGAAAFAGVAISLRLPALSHFSGGTSGNQ